MRRILYLFAIITLMGQVSCGEFLKDTSGDLLIPKSVNDFMSLLYGEGYPKDLVSETGFITLMTDDIAMGPLEGSENIVDVENVDGLWAYSWEPNVEEKIGDGVWDKCYQYILGCNLIIQALPTITYDAAEEDLYNSLASSAYGLRAYYYFCLINWYAEPYSKENLSKLGVIIKTNPSVTLSQFERNTIGEVYELINGDIEKSREYGKKGRATSNKFLFSANATEFLANRIALFQEKWDEVITDGEAFITLNKKLFDLNAADKTKFGIDKEPFTMFNLNNNPEILFSFGKTGTSSSPYKYLSFVSFYGYGFQMNYFGPNSLFALYDENDLRSTAYYKIDFVDKYGDKNFEFHYPLKYIGATANIGYMVNWRNVEVYLNVAEAYARKDEGISARAIELLNTIRINRFDNKLYKNLTVADFANKEALVKFVWEERRRELSFEETMRFWDLRRQGCKQVVHEWYTSLTNFDTYTLTEKNPNFTLQIPISEYGINSKITTNNRVTIDKNK